MPPLRWSRSSHSATSSPHRHSRSPALANSKQAAPKPTTTQSTATTNTNTNTNTNTTTTTTTTPHTKTSSTMAPKPSEPTTYYLLPNLRALDTSACEVDLDAHSWVQPIIIDDEDLTFGGKSLSEWYEEDRSRLSSGGSDDGHGNEDAHDSHSHHRRHQDRAHGEERRGRERVRRSHGSSSGKSHRK